ncbi:neurogenic locus notch homolog protein 1-like isoform X2 [Uloborus diversus]|uniref:neurogenic locus notch homolog protein 1-like isoform X2 n=1 Tax=Uloborus diversus TaxID=327109 RepID=UPI0024093F7F|nr:neurogenic locus notch homolog protein 1-like isoform X2 [Uloborus diversus]
MKLAKCDCRNELFYEKETQTCIDCKTCGKDYHGCKIAADDAISCLCNEGFIQHGMECKECDCGRNGTCSFDESNEKVCACIPDFLVNNGKCQECQCGTHGNCSFVKGQKHCNCDEKYGFNGEKCVDCQCGKATGCTFEAGSKTCDCLPDFAQKGESCEECKCGKNSICSFVDGEKNCTCQPKFALKDKECTACDCHETSVGCIFDGDKTICLCAKGYALNETKCTECDCVHGICSFEKGQKQCSCDKGYAFKDGVCQVCDCGEHGKCLFDDSGSKTCECDDGYAFRDGKCHAICQQESCENGGTCDEETKFCSCKNGTEGDFCKIVVDCLDSLKECKGDNGKCTYNVSNQKAQCDCPTGKEFDNSSKKCKITCTEKSCKNQGQCKERFCICNEGTSGDLCDIVDECSKLNETCHNATAVCKYAADKPGKAACFCTEDDYTFDEAQSQCKPIWCEENACGVGSECKFENGVGYCECKNSKQYYNYKNNKCEEYDPCLLMTCKANQICDEGTCKCMEKYKEVEEKCVPNFCSENPCFTGATCVETEVPGVVNCLCNGKMYFDGNKCTDGSCFLNDYRQNCTEKCPPGLERDDNGICLHKNESYRCDKNCQYGSCVLKDGDETCVCIPKYAKLQDGVCILNADVVCASKLLTDDLSKCNATEPYKYAENGITLEKKSCADKEVADKCLDAAATCKDSWNKETVHECACEEGYTKDSSGYCAEGCQSGKKSECMEEGKSCYINELKQAKCDCPPPLSWNEETKTCNKLDENTFMVQNLPVLKKKYVRKDGSIDKVLLNTHIIQSMKQVYKNIDNTYMFNYDQSEDILNCSVIVKFSKGGKSEVKRIRMLKLPEINCTDCDENLSVLPPSLFLGSKSLNQVTDEQADLCSKPLTKTLCGDYAECKENKCFCRDGFRVTDYSVQKYKQFTILRCEDVNECADKKHVCHESTNSTCENTIGGYYCKCLPGFKKIDTKLPFETQENKDPCSDLCTPDPCYKGTCLVKDKAFDCNCELGYSGSLCNREDSPLKKANKSIKIVGAVLGTLLGVTILLFIAYVWRETGGLCVE